MISALISWYLVDFPKRIFDAWKNFLKFGLHYFSIPFLLKTLFSHWRKYVWAYPKSFDIGKILEAFISNQISRLIGAFARTFLILIGLIFEVLILIVGILTFFSWFLLPVFLILIFIYGIRFLF
jgi:uncharacterized membrane protein